MEEVPFEPELRLLAERFVSRLGAPGLAQATLEFVRERAPDERLALAFLLKLAEQSRDSLVQALDDPARASDLVFCLGASEMIATGLCSAGTGWLEFFERARTTTHADLTRLISFDVAQWTDANAAAQALGDFKLRIFLQIGIADLLKQLSVTETIAAMSGLADECIRAALEIASRIAGPRALPKNEFCVVAMGKLGARELNLSSDIDLIYVFDSPDDHKRQEAARLLSEAFTDILTARCFRTDLRLRPGGKNAPLAVSFEGALNFYQSFGQTWERAALLRARPVAGNVDSGRRLLAELGYFVYRRFLDFDTLRQLRAMKHQIEQELRSPDLVERNVKLGRGGIRELEFIVQALTLIYGGRDPRLRTAETLAALDRLDSYGYLASSQALKLKDAYLFLRDVEHKLQVAAGLQTHTIPADDRAVAVVAARLGFGKDSGAVARMRSVMRDHRMLVARQFREMLAGGEQRKETRVSENAERAWQSSLEPERSIPPLVQLGFNRPEESARNLALLARGPSLATTTPWRRELMDRLGPVLLDEIRTLADPDLALMNLASFIAAIGAHTSFLALLEEHPATRHVLLRLFASSSYLSSLFIRHPDMLDTLVRSDLARLRRSREEIAQELSGLVAACDDVESRLDAIRAFRHQEFLRIAIADLAGNLKLADVQDELTLLAETVLREALALARIEVDARRPTPAGLRLCAVAMGRLGAAEMSYNSDLDLIFVYDHPDEAAAGGHEAATRIVQKLIAILEARTREGYAYKLDLRLRPSGNSGPLVTSLGGFLDYHRQSSAVWERQALVRARVIAGDAKLGERVERARREFVFGRGLDPAGVAEIAAMRARMENEIGAENRHRLNLKQGPGGLVDVEFLTQMMVLRHGCQYEELRQRGTVKLIRALQSCGLMRPEEADEIESGYRFLSRLENRLRIETDQAAWALPTALEELTPIAKRMGYKGADAAERLLAELERRRAIIRAIFQACFEREQLA